MRRVLENGHKPTDIQTNVVLSNKWHADAWTNWQWIWSHSTNASVRIYAKMLHNHSSASMHWHILNWFFPIRHYSRHVYIYWICWHLLALCWTGYFTAASWTCTIFKVNLRQFFLSLLYRINVKWNTRKIQLFTTLYRFDCRILY